MLQRIDEIQHSRRRYLASLNVSKLIRFQYLNINLDIFSISDVLQIACTIHQPYVKFIVIIENVIC